jgi:hypothetical protein
MSSVQEAAADVQEAAADEQRAGGSCRWQQ